MRLQADLELVPDLDGFVPYRPPESPTRARLR
jgi:hypothetical protein